MGDYEGAKKNSITAHNLIIAAIITGAVMTIVGFFILGMVEVVARVNTEA